MPTAPDPFVTTTPHLLGADVAFDVVFAVFVVAFAVLAVVTVRWAVKRDRAGRADWVRRQAPGRDVRPRARSARMNGHAPGHGPEGRRGGQGPRGGSPRAR